MNKILWLASYPKSGNTWLRVLLANYWRDGELPLNVNQLAATPVASSREIFDDLVGLDSAELLPNEINALRHDAYMELAREAKVQPLLKIHDAYHVPGAPRLVPPEATRGAVYIARNPLDVAVSFAHHSGWSVAKSVRNMCDDSFAMARTGRRLAAQLSQRLLSWSGHVRSWLDEPPFPVHLVRFEDLKADTEGAFAGVLSFVGTPVERRRLEKAVRFSDFAVLQGMEAEHGFEERSPRSSQFFRRGEVGGWRESLGPELVRAMLERHEDVMRRLGYEVDLERLLPAADATGAMPRAS